jgi:hypothetical protein
MRCFPDVILLDTTYKMNRYGIQLLQIGGTTPMNTSFSGRFCFLGGETEEDYSWAIGRSMISSELKGLKLSPLTITRPFGMHCPRSLIVFCRFFVCDCVTFNRMFCSASRRHSA